MSMKQNDHFRETKREAQQENQPETYVQFCERHIASVDQLDKYQWGELAFAAGQTSGLNKAIYIMKGEDE